MKVELSLDELQEILEWCDGVESADMPWIPMEIPLYRRLRIIHKHQSSTGTRINTISTGDEEGL